MPRLKIVLQSKQFILLSLIFITFYLLITTKVIKYESIYPVNTNSITGIVKSFNFDGNKLSLIISGKEDFKGTYYFKNEKELNNIKDTMKLGSSITVNGNLVQPSINTIPNTFNYKEYLYNKHIYWTVNIKSIKLNNDNISFIYRIKNAFITRLNKFTSNEYLYAFILGDKNYIDSDTYEKFSNNGVTHLFAVSGMHVSFLVLAIEFFLNKFKVNSKITSSLIISFLIFYMFLIGFTASVVRASLLYILLLINKKLNINIKGIFVLYILFLFLLIINPFYIYDLGFIYSFLTTFGLMLFSKKISGNYLTKLLKVSFIAFIFSLPVTLYNFYEFNLLTVLNNLVMVPFVSIILFPLAVIIFIIPLLEPILSICVNILEFLNSFLDIISINLVVGKINIIFIIIYYFIVYLIYKHTFKFSLLFIIFIFIYKLIPFLDNNSYVYYLDVGQGDSTFIITENRKDIIMIDTGGKIDFKKDEWMKTNHNYNLADNITSFIKSLGISKLHLLIITHGDMDHLGYAKDISEDLKINNLMLNNNGYNKKELELKNVIPSLIKNNYHGYNLDITNLNELKNKDENDSSLVLNISLKKHNLLIMGDAPKEVESNILNKYKLKIDILKLGHHGSKTSSDYNFLKTIRPKLSIISAGRNNRYNHPSLETLENLNNLNLKYLSTKEVGTIFIKFSKNAEKIKIYEP